MVQLPHKCLLFNDLAHHKFLKQGCSLGQVWSNSTDMQQSTAAVKAFFGIFFQIPFLHKFYHLYWN